MKPLIRTLTAVLAVTALATACAQTGGPASSAQRAVPDTSGYGGPGALASAAGSTTPMWNSAVNPSNSGDSEPAPMNASPYGRQ